MNPTRFQPGPGSHASFVKASLLFLVLVGVAWLSFHVSRHGLPPALNAFLQSESVLHDETIPYSPEQKDSLKRACAGFWTCSVDSTSAMDFPGRILSRLELKENGIIWQVHTYFLRLPDTSVDTFYHVIHGVYNPFGRVVNRPLFYADGIVIRQVALTPADTCYGKSFDTTAWQFNRRSETLIYDAFSYVPYTDASIDTFFPPGMIGLIDSFFLDECREHIDYSRYGTEKIHDVLADSTRDLLSVKTIQSIAATHYFPLFMLDVKGSLWAYGLHASDSIPVRFGVHTATGAVEASVTFDPSVGSELLKQTLSGRMATWVFPRQRDSDTLREVSFTYRYDTGVYGSF